MKWLTNLLKTPTLEERMQEKLKRDEQERLSDAQFTLTWVGRSIVGDVPDRFTMRPCRLGNGPVRMEILAHYGDKQFVLGRRGEFPKLLPISHRESTDTHGDVYVIYPTEPTIGTTLEMQQWLKGKAS